MTNHVEDTGLVTIGELKLVMMDKDEWRGRIHIRSKLALHQNEMNEGGSYPPKPNPYTASVEAYCHLYIRNKMYVREDVESNAI